MTTQHRPATAGSSGPDLSNLRGDMFGGITAGVVALPLALAFGEASGAGPIAGIWGAIVLGVVASLLGGTPSMISGPTGPMVVVFAGVYASVDENASLVFAAVVLGGLLQILFGFIQLGKYIRLVPYPVISGFMSGIAVIIVALQASRLFGGEPEGRGTVAGLEAIPDAVQNVNWNALGVAVVALIIVFGWPKRLASVVPGALVALVAGTVAGQLLGDVPTIGEIPFGFPDVVLPTLTADTAAIILEGAIIFAILGSIDTLLTSLVADNMTQGRHDSNRELVGQGIGNALVGLVGGMPGAGATSTSVVSIRAGGRTRLAGLFYSLLLVAVVFVAGPLAEQIPTAVLAAILVKVAWDILDISYLKRAHQGPRWDLVLMAVVLAMTVFVDLITAVAIGVVMAAMGFIKRLADEQLATFDITDDPRSEEELALLRRAEGRVAMFRFDGPLSFGAAADLGHHVRERTAGETRAMVLDFGRMSFVDVSAITAIETIFDDAQSSKTSVFIARMNTEVAATMADMQVPEYFSFDSRLDALRAAVDIVFMDRNNETAEERT